MKILILCLFLFSLSCSKSNDVLDPEGMPKVDSIEDSRKLKEVWKTYKTEILKHQKGDFMLNPPATAAQIADFEKLIKNKLPEDLKEFYLIANGQKYESEYSIVRPGFNLMPLEECTKAIEGLKPRSGKKMSSGLSEMMGVKFNQHGVKDEYDWLDKWIPIATDHFGNYLCIDYDPAKGGKAGQLISVYFDDVGRNIFAYSVKGHFAFIEKGLKEGSLKFHEEVGPYTLEDIKEFERIDKENEEL